jgi:ATP-binding cassette subfamily G (WHITE) protein 2 (SNQ2)
MSSYNHYTDHHSSNTNPGSSDADTLPGDFSYEGSRETLRNSNHHGLTHIRSGVDVGQAEADFAELNRRLSGISQHSKRLSRHESRKSGKAEAAGDVEKRVSSEESEEAWDLESSLRGSQNANDEAGIKPKNIGMIYPLFTMRPYSLPCSRLTRYLGVIWDGLTVRGRGGVKNIVKTFPDAVVDFFNVPETIMNIFGWGKKGQEFDILNNFKGVAKPGEMVLVLGKPGSGCTTFLKVISNQRFGYTGFEGDVQYGPFGSDEFAKRFRGEAVYNQEDDIHHASLTVGQTLNFALDTKTPGKRPAGMSKQEFKKSVCWLPLALSTIDQYGFHLLTLRIIGY